MVCVRHRYGAESTSTASSHTHLEVYRVSPFHPVLDESDRSLNMPIKPLEIRHSVAREEWPSECTMKPERSGSLAPRAPSFEEY